MLQCVTYVPGIKRYLCVRKVILIPLKPLKTLGFGLDVGFVRAKVSGRTG